MKITITDYVNGMMVIVKFLLDVIVLLKNTIMTPVTGIAMLKNVTLIMELAILPDVLVNPIYSLTEYAIYIVTPQYATMTLTALYPDVVSVAMTY
jgi:hypothetical protein